MDQFPRDPPAVNKPVSRLPVCISPTISASLPWSATGEHHQLHCAIGLLRHFSAMDNMLLCKTYRRGRAYPA